MTRKGRLMIRKLTPTKAIKYKCLQCSGGSATEVKFCTVKDCPLYEYRFGHIPKEYPVFDDGKPEPTLEEKERRRLNGQILYERLRAKNSLAGSASEKTDGVVCEDGEGGDDDGQA